MVPKVPSIVLAASLMFGAASGCAQDTPKPIPPMDDASIRRTEPQVEYVNGKLRILAQQSMLGEVLDAVRNRTGAVISAPPEITAQRVTMKVGPAPLLDVVTELLELSECNYIVVGSAAHPDTIRVSVLPKPSGPELQAFADAAHAAPKNPGNIPDSSNVTLLDTTNQAESDSAAPATNDAVSAPSEAEAANDTEKPAPDAADTKDEKANPELTAAKDTDKPNPDAAGSKDTEKPNPEAAGSKDTEKPNPDADNANQAQNTSVPK